ncbi:hypothetical protein ACFWOY_07750 [Streptomyces sp. NPDC058423]|uniref:hypothetical protein n=1 Tax=unclassified Streptomyces TaxID=2593676 RepID=UPI003648AE54
MLTMMTKRSTVDAHPEDAMRLLSSQLPDTYQAIVGPLVRHQATLLGIPEESLQKDNSRAALRYGFNPDEEIIGAEVFAKGSTLIAVRLTQSTRTRRVRTEEGEASLAEVRLRSIYVSYAAPEIQEENFAEFEACVTRIWNADLKEVKQPLRRLREIAPNGQAESPSASDIECAGVLSDKSSRALAIAIKSSSGLLLSDAPKQIPPKERGRLDEIVQSLAKVGLVETEIVVICAKNATQTNRVPNLEVLKSLDEQGVRCSCGKLLSNEKAEEALSITDYGRSMLDGSRWMSVLVLQELLKLGIPIESIRMEQEYSGEEVDCMADVYGRLVLFELKDKQFNLGNAYSFGAKVGIFRPDYPVIVTTEKVGSDAREHFVRSANSERGRERFLPRDRRVGNDMTFIEGLSSLRQGLESVISSIAIEAFSPSLEIALSHASVSAESILSVWATGGTAK